MSCHDRACNRRSTALTSVHPAHAARGAYADASDIANHGGDGAFFSKENNRTFFWKGAVAVMLTHFLNDSGQLRSFAEELGKAAITKV